MSIEQIFERTECWCSTNVRCYVPRKRKHPPSSCGIADKRGGVLLRVSVCRIKAYNVDVEESGQVILDPQSDSDQHQNVISCTWSPLAHAYRVWSTSVNAFVSYPAHRTTDGMTDKQRRSHNPALVEVNISGNETVTLCLTFVSYL